MSACPPHPECGCECDRGGHTRGQCSNVHSGHGWGLNSEQQAKLGKGAQKTTEAVAVVEGFKRGLTTNSMETENEAAEWVMRKKGDDLWTVFVAFAVAGDHGLTNSEAASVTELWEYTVDPRRRNLTEAGLVVASDQKRPSPRGRPQTVWVLSDMGRNIAQRVL